MSLWFAEPTLDALNALAKETLIGHLAIEFTTIGADFLTAKMPVDRRTVQPFGLLHGGASVVLAETLGSVAAMLCVDSQVKLCVGLEINANHVRAARTGFVFGTVRPIHIGGSTQIWQTQIHDEQERLICVSRLTVAVLDRKS
ncbi:MAG: hotdog fold thioesterase [Caldilineaceae bacterium]|nr:hotdog fold thioesterase [Caldilineaceae bacterium]